MTNRKKSVAYQKLLLMGPLAESDPVDILAIYLS